MNQLTKISEEDMKLWGVFAPMARFLNEMNNHMANISHHLYAIEDALASINSKIQHQSSYGDGDCEHQ